MIPSTARRPGLVVTTLLSALLLAVPPATGLVAQEAFRSDALGLTFRAPRAGWERVESVTDSGGGRRFEFREPATADGEGEGESEGCVASLIVWDIGEGPALDALCDSELRQMAARGAVEEIGRGKRSVAGHEALGFRYRLVRRDEGRTVIIDTTYLWVDSRLARLAVTVPLDREAELQDLVPGVAGGVTFAARPSRSGAHREAAQQDLSEPIEWTDPADDHLLTVVHDEDPEALPLRFLEALPGAARRGAGRPVVLAARHHLPEPARAFVGKWRPGQIHVIGPPLAELPQATLMPAGEVEGWPAGGDVVVSSRALCWAVQAGCLAIRLPAPLLIAGDDLERRLESLRPGRVLLFGDVELPDLRARVERLSGPRDVARLAGGADYLALCNVSASAFPQTAVLAAVLAGVRGGVVLPVEMPMARHRVPLEVTAACPPGLEGLQSTGSYLQARIHAGDRQILAGAPQTSVVRVASNDAPRYGRLRIDLDGDDVLEDDEEVRIGSRVELGQNTYHLTYHYAHPFIPYQPSEILLDEFDPEALRGVIRSAVGALGGVDDLAIVGGPTCVPFCYREATGYFEAFDIKQELVGDAPYADLDGDGWRGPLATSLDWHSAPGAAGGWDGHLELAVGRLPIDDLVAGSAAVAATICYPVLDGDWVGRATAIQPGFYEMEGSLPWVLPNAEALVRGIGADLSAAGLEVRGYYRDQVAIDDVIASMAHSGWIAYFNHSGPSAWGIHPGSSIVTRASRRADDRALPALEGAPIVFGGGCSSAALDVGQPLGSTFAGRFFELGAVAYLGNTRVASARSEHLVQEFFARLAAGGDSVGQAFRKSRNLVAHLLRGGHLVGRIDKGIELGERDFLWGQYFILNLFADPALVPRLPAGRAPPIEVALHAAGTGEDRMRLDITNGSEVRDDPVMMMPAPGQGKPREFLVRTGAGMTSSHLPMRFVGEDLEPVRSIPEIGPGVWIDEPLPRGTTVRDVSLAPDSIRVSGSVPRDGWFDRGFAVVQGAHGESRLEMFVPLVRASLDGRQTTVARRLGFDIRLAPASSAESSPPADTLLEPRVVIEDPWRPKREGTPRISPEARRLLDRARSARAPLREWLASVRVDWVMSNPQERLYGESARFRGWWTEAGRAAVESEGLGDPLRARRSTIEAALGAVASLPFADPLPPLAGLQVEAGADGQLLLRPLDADGPDAETWVVELSESGLVERIIHHNHGLSDQSDYQWRETDQGPLLVGRIQFDRVRPQERVIHEVAYGSRWGYLLPEKITLRLPGKLARGYACSFEYSSRRRRSATEPR